MLGCQMKGKGPAQGPNSGDLMVVGIEPSDPSTLTIKP